MKLFHQNSLRRTTGRASYLFFLVLALSVKGLLFSSATSSHPLPLDDVELIVPVIVPAQKDQTCSIDGELTVLLDLHNQSRNKGLLCGRVRKRSTPPLILSCELSRAAKKHADDLHANNFLAHQGSDGKGMGDRALDAAYRWRNVGENIAQGFNSPELVYQTWLESASHCQNIASHKFEEWGAAKVGVTWVVMFGRR